MLNSARHWFIEPISLTGRHFDERVDILVEDSLVSPLCPGLDTMAADLTLEGYQVALFSVSGNSAESLRSFLQAEYDSGLVAAVLIGDLPVSWFQQIDDWNSNGVRDPDDHYEEFPCDLFFMDLDGTWQDSFVRLDTLDSLIPGTDSIYDLHFADIEPEIGISRIPIPAVGPADSVLLHYLDKAHRYRLGQLNVLDRALVYIDDDWRASAGQWNQNVGILYPSRVFVWERESTRAIDYRPRIDSAAYQWIQICAHSWPLGHGFRYAWGDSWDYFFANEIPGIDPEACFYNLFACSNARFVEAGFCAGRYVLETSAGLGAIGSAKTGSMLEFDDFYTPLADGEPMALAFRDWFRTQIADTLQAWERSWYYGMCLIGDGLLVPRLYSPVQEPAAHTPALPQVRLRGNPARTSVNLELALTNSSPAQVLLCDRTGRTVYSIRHARLHPGTHPFTIDTRELTSGVYFLVLETNSGRTSLPVTVAR